MRAFSKWMAWGSVAGALALSACGSERRGRSGSSGASWVTQDPPEVAHWALLREALAKVSLRADQKADVDQLGQEARGAARARSRPRASPCAAPSPTKLQAGKIDRAALKPQIDALLAAIDQSRPADRAALVRLHDFARQEPAQASSSTRSKLSFSRACTAAVPAWPHARQWAADLNLTDEQRDQIRAALRVQVRRAARADERTLARGARARASSARVVPPGSVHASTRTRRSSGATRSSAASAA